MSAIVVGFWLRFAQAGIEACLTLVIGAVVAGVLRRMVGPAGTRRLFGSGAKGLVRGWLAGMLLPVCSLGVIPVAREMRRAGVPGGTVLAFVLAAPLLNPISFLYGLTLAEPVVILCFAAASLGLSTFAGFLWDRAFAGSAAVEEDAALAAKADEEPVPSAGLRRILAVVATSARELAGRDLAFYGLGLVGSAALAAAIPFGYLQHTMKHSDASSPLLMAALAVPLFTSPLPGMMKIGLMFEHGNSLAAAFVLFALGIGTSLGTLAWLGTDFRWRRVLPWFAAYVLAILALGYAAEPVLYDTRKPEIDHTHAFDDYSCPFQPGAGWSETLGMANGKLEEKLGPLERPAVYALGGLVLLGTLLRLDRRGRFEGWLVKAPEAAAGRWDVAVPGPVLGAVSILGLIAFSVVGAYLYYPDREQCVGQMEALRADTFVAVNGGKKDEAIRHLEMWDLLVRKLEVGQYLRTFGVAKEQSKACEDLREELEEVRDHLLAGDVPAAKAAFDGPVATAYRACKDAFPKSAP